MVKELESKYAKKGGKLSYDAKKENHIKKQVFKVLECAKMQIMRICECPPCSADFGRKRPK